MGGVVAGGAGPGAGAAGRCAGDGVVPPGPGAGVAPGATYVNALGSTTEVVAVATRTSTVPGDACGGVVTSRDVLESTVTDEPGLVPKRTRMVPPYPSPSMRTRVPPSLPPQRGSRLRTVSVPFVTGAGGGGIGGLGWLGAGRGEGEGCSPGAAGGVGAGAGQKDRGGAGAGQAHEPSLDGVGHVHDQSVDGAGWVHDPPAGRVHQPHVQSPGDAPARDGLVGHGLPPLSGSSGAGGAGAG